MTRTILLVLPVLLAGCGGGEATNSAAIGNSVAVVPPQPGGPVEDVPAGEGAMAGRPEQDDAAAMAADDGAAGPVAARAERDYIGRWVGVEGLMLTVSRKPGGGVSIDNQWSLDDRGRFDGSVTAEGLRFVRNGKAATASPSDGDATGLKWLAGKQDCLTVQPGEGYCRD